VADGSAADVGFIGLGNQGLPMAERLVQSDRGVTLWARRAASLEPFAGTRATVVETPADLALRCSIVCLCVSGDDDVRELVHGERGLRQGFTVGTVLVVHSTVLPETCRELAVDLHPLGVEVLDAPVSGGAGGARAGTLTIMVGGDVDAFARVESVLEEMGRPTHLGPVGSGLLMKLLNNGMLIANMRVAREGFALAQDLGIDVEAAERVLQSSSGGSFAIPSMIRFRARDDLWRVRDNLAKDLHHFDAIRAGQPSGALLSRLGHEHLDQFGTGAFPSDANAAQVPGRRPAIAVNLPLKGVELAAHRDVLDTLVRAGFDSVWADEFNGVDAMAALAAFAAWQPTIDVTSSIVNVFTRGPALLAMAAAALGEIAPHRSTFGISSSSEVIVSGWNGLPYERPLTRVAETLAFLRAVLADGQCKQPFTTIAAQGFRLAKVPTNPPRLAVGALGPRMQRLAAAHADTLITGMVAPYDIERVRENLSSVDREPGDPLRIEVGLFLVPRIGDIDVDMTSRRHLTGYLPVPSYARFQQWLGRGPALADMLDRWANGDRKGAVAALPSDVVDDLVVKGSADECARRIVDFLDTGIDGVNLMIPAGVTLDASVRVAFLCDVARSLTQLRAANAAS
jgi:probable F420-dependent oxidoreductase